MAQNPNVQFGRSIKPVSVKDVQLGSVQRLYHKNSENARSANITVGTEPVVLVAFGLKEGETVEVRNVFENLEVTLVMGGTPAILSNENTLQVLPIGGVYCLQFSGEALGDLVVIAYKMSAMDPKALKTVDLTNPNGPQKNRPNLFLDGSAGVLETKPFFVGTTPIVFRAYGLVGQTLALYAVFEDEEVRVTETYPVGLSSVDTTLVISIAGQYKFKVLDGDSAGVTLVANPTTLNYFSTGFDNGPDDGGGAADGVTFVGTGAGLTGGPIVGSGTIALNAASLEAIALAESALQSGDDVSELVNNVGYIDDDDTIDGGNF